MNKISEKSIVNKILKYANSFDNILLYKRHGAGFGNGGQPDLYGAVNGRHTEIEVKAPDGKPTKLQLHHLDKWQSKGAITGIAKSVDDFKQILSNHDVQI